jgi:hypothetical protein
MNCTDAYRAALIQDFQPTAPPGPDPAAGATESGQVTVPGTGFDDISTER